MVASTLNGYTGPDTASPTAAGRSTLRTFWDGQAAAADINIPGFPGYSPGGYFDTHPELLDDPQPEGRLQKADGPLPGDDDATWYVYFPATTAEPHWRGLIAEEIDPLGRVTRYSDYDPFGNPGAIELPDGVVRRFEYDALGRTVRTRLEAGSGCDATDPLCQSTLEVMHTYWDTVGPLKDTEQPGGLLTRYTYDAWGRNVLIERGPGGGAMQERVLRTFAPAGVVRQELQRLEAKVWVTAHQTDYAYWDSGRVRDVVRPAIPQDPNPPTETYHYDLAGNIMSFQDAGHSSENVAYEYRRFGEMEKVRQQVAGTSWVETEYDYDCQGNLRLVTDANGNETAYVVDDFGQTVSIDSPVTGLTTFTYREDGRTASASYATGRTVSNTYDDAGRLRRSDYDKGGETDQVRYTYDVRDRPVRVIASGDSVVQWWSYSSRGALLRYWQTTAGVSAQVEYQYSPDGRRIGVTYPSGLQVRYGLDWAGRPEEMSVDGQLWVAKASHLPFGPLESWELVDAGEQALAGEFRQYDLQYRLTHSMAPRQNRTLLVGRQYAYDAVGNLQTETDLATSTVRQQLGYDGLGRLVTATGPYGDYSYTYDGIGNRLSRTDTDGTPDETLSYLQNPHGHNSPLLASVQNGFVHPVTHDLEGNVTDDGIARYTIGPRNRVQEHRSPTDELLRDRAYTGAGLLASSQAGTAGPRRVLVRDTQGRLVEEQIYPDGSTEPTQTTSYIWLGDQLLMTWDSSQVEPSRFILSNHIGYPIASIKPDRQYWLLEWDGDHEPFGSVVGDTTNAPRLRYPGQWAEHPALEAHTPTSRSHFINGHRWYVPEWGRYSQSDPVGLIGPLTSLPMFQALLGSTPDHLFSYSGSNPLRFTDPLGLAKRTRPCGFTFVSIGGKIGDINNQLIFCVDCCEGVWWTQLYWHGSPVQPPPPEPPISIGPRNPELPIDPTYDGCWCPDGQKIYTNMQTRHALFVSQFAWNAAHVFLEYECASGR